MSYTILAPRRRRGLGDDTSNVPGGGVLQAQNGWSYQLTPDDLLWLARSAEAEGGGRPDATIWCLAQDFALHQSATFTDLIRSYSQPVNPIWSDPNSSKCIANPNQCSPSTIASRLAHQSKPWSSISTSVTDAVTAFAQAQLPNPVPRAVEFADASVSQNFVDNHPGSTILFKSRLIGDANWYIVTAATNNWPNNFVTVAYGGVTSTEQPANNTTDVIMIVAGATGVVLAGGFAYWAWRRARTRRR